MNKYQEALHYFIRWLNPIEEDFNQEIYRKHRNNLQELIDKETQPTLEQVKKEWEELGYSFTITQYTPEELYLENKNGDAIVINLVNKRFQKYDDDCEPIYVSFKEYQLLTKTFRALKWEV